MSALPPDPPHAPHLPSCPTCKGRCRAPYAECLVEDCKVCESIAANFGPNMATTVDATLSAAMPSKTKRTDINPESVKNPFPLPWKADLLDEQDDYIAIEAANGREVARIMRGPLGFTGVELGVARLIAEAFSGKKQPKHYKTFTQHNKEWIQAADVESLRAYAEASNEFSDQWSKERASLEAKLEALEKDFEHAEAEVARLKALDEERCREIQRLRDNETKALVDWTKLRDESESWRHNALAMEGALNAASQKHAKEKKALVELVARVVDHEAGMYCESEASVAGLSDCQCWRCEWVRDALSMVTEYGR